MKDQQLQLFFILCLSVMIISCRDPYKLDKTRVDRSLSPAMETFIPYKINDNISFTNNTQTINLTCTEKIKKIDINNDCSYGSYPPPCHEFYDDAISCSLTCATDSIYNFMVTISSKGSPNCSFYIERNYKPNTLKGVFYSYDLFNIDSLSYQNYFSSNDYGYISSLTVNSNNFSNVIWQKNDYSSTDTVYFTAMDGIIKFTLDNGSEKWYLVK